MRPPLTALRSPLAAATRPLCLVVAGISSVVHWRGLLQAADGTTGTPKTAGNTVPTSEKFAQFALDTQLTTHKRSQAANSALVVLRSHFQSEHTKPAGGLHQRKRAAPPASRLAAAVDCCIVSLWGGAADRLPRPSTFHLPRGQVTEPFSNRTYSASGKQAPTGADVDDLARQICSSYEGAGARLFDMVRAGGRGGSDACIWLHTTQRREPALPGGGSWLGNCSSS